MGSPKTDGNAVDISAVNSPSEQKSPISQFLNDLSPIKSPTASVSTQRLSEPSFPTIPSVFTSPHHLDMEQKPSFLQREEIGGSSSNAPGQCFLPFNSTLRPCIQKPLQSCGPSESVGEYQADPMVLDGARHGETCAQSADDVGARMLPHLAQKHLVSGSLRLVEASDDQSLDERLDKILEFSSENFWDHVVSDEFIEHQVGQDASRHQQGLQRHLQVEATSDRKSDAAFNYHTSSRPEIEVPSLVESKRISKGLQAIYSGQAMTSQGSFLGSKSVISTENGPGRSNNLLEDMNNGPLSSTAMEAGDHIASDHQNSQSLQWDSQKVSSFNQLTLPSDGKIPGQQFANRVNEELSQCQDSSKGKRKRETYTDESESCKLCNCKRSKCLKLYCECFAAGIYCVDSCACENCFNKPDYEDTVQDVRQEIESRNPLAFAPTIVSKADDSPNIAGDANSMTPSSARHKRGCKCKRSKCLKKYCECYRAKVGCSDGCHCEDCDNSFGKKSESTFQRAEKWKNPSHGKLNTEVEMMSDSTEVQTADQFSPTWRQLVDMNHLNPLASLNMVVDCPNVSQAESQKESGLQWCSSALSPTQACASKMSELDSTINELREIMGDASPDILMQDSNPTNTVKSGSPNQKRVSPPQPQRLGSNSPPGWRHGRKLVLPDEPSYPPPTTHCNSDDRMNQTENEHQDRSNN